MLGAKRGGRDADVMGAGSVRNAADVEARAERAPSVGNDQGWAEGAGEPGGERRDVDAMGCSLRKQSSDVAAA